MKKKEKRETEAHLIRCQKNQTAANSNHGGAASATAAERVVRLSSDDEGDTERTKFFFFFLGWCKGVLFLGPQGPMFCRMAHLGSRENDWAN